MYVLTSRVRYSEIDESGALSPLSLINYLQDCSTFHAEDVGAGIAASVERRTAWMIAAWKIRIHRLPSMGESIRIRTWPTGFKGLMSNRNFVMEPADAPEGATPLVEADSAWFLFDVDAGRPRRLVREDLSCYLENDAFEPALDMLAVQRRLRVPRDAEPVVADVVTVTGSHIDTNHHVNNAQYVRSRRRRRGACGSCPRSPSRAGSTCSTWPRRSSAIPSCRTCIRSRPQKAGRRRCSWRSTLPTAATMRW